MKKKPAVVRLGLIQTRSFTRPDLNLRHTLTLAERAARQGAQILCTQELFRSPYFCQTEDCRHFDLAEPIPGPTTRAFQKVARSFNVVCVVSIFERRAPGLYHNAAAIIDANGALLGIYRKMHIPDDPLFYEKFYFAPGDLGYRAWPTRHGRIGVLICWDQWFPEAARLTALQGAQILLYPTAIGWHPAEKKQFGAAQHDAWELSQRSHAVANGCFVAAVNRIGLERPAGGDGLQFWGQSFVANPSGQLLARASACQEQVLIVPIDLGSIDTTRTQWPFLRDRRVDTYGGLCHRWLDPADPGHGS